MKKIILALMILTIGTIHANTPPWSKTGHRTIGEIAQEFLTRKARKNLSKLLNGQDLASVSNSADFIKADRQYRDFSAWHYVNIPPDKDYHEVEPSPYGDLVTGIAQCMEVLENPSVTEEDRVFYLKMLVHLIGDLHQPMHVGRAEDKGGNDFQLQWFDRGTNLHKLWDSNMIDDFGMSYTELASSLPKWSKQQIKSAQQGSILDWVKETQQVANKVYDSVEVGEKLYYRYNYDWWSTVERQLLLGGIRLARVLNDIYG